MATTQELTFSQGTQFQTVDVVVIDNSVFENTEEFFAQLITADSRVTIVNSSAETQIGDDDSGMGYT